MPATGIGQLGLNIAGQAAGGIMGMVLGKQNDERQYEQAQRLQQLQIQGQEQLTDYNMSKQLQMWHQTNYGAQVDELNKAGLNPALLYGGGGGGGTTANVSQGSVSGQSASQNPGEAQAMASQGIQAAMGLQLMKAQEQVLETQADKNQAEADATRGVQTDVGRQNIAESQARIDNLMQGLDNMRQDYEVKKLEITMKNIENFEKQASQPDRLSYIKTEAATAIQLYKSVSAEAKIDQAAVNDRIKIIQEQAINSVIQNMQARSNVRKTDQEINQIVNNIMNGVNQQSNQNQELDIRRQLKDFDTDPTNNATEQAVRAIGGILSHSLHHK